MSIFKRLFGGRLRADAASSASPVPTPAPAPPPDPAHDPNLIRVYDSYGRELFITRQQWRDNVLIGNIQRVWDKPDELYSVVLSALNDGFRSDIVKAAEHLYKIDCSRTRGTCVWGIVLMEEGRLDEAESVFRDFLRKNGEEGVILTNLAKVCSKRSNRSEAERILWHALEVDPNQDNAVVWYEAIHRERDGEAAGQEALRRIAALAASWRAQLWLARTALASGGLNEAIGYYEQSLGRAGRPAPGNLLMQMSGDLGNRGHLQELLRLTAPQFDAAVHGLEVGNNLIKANVDLGRLDEAKRLVEVLYTQNRPDWKETLGYWDTEITKKRLQESQAAREEPIKVAMLTIEGPIWLRSDSPATGLFSSSGPDAPLVCFFGCTAETGSAATSPQKQISDAPGRLSRALPLFLAEQTSLNACARTRTLIAWITAPACGFVLSGVAWEDSEAAHLAREGSEPAEYLVATHLIATCTPWRARMRIIRTIDGTCLTERQEGFDPAQPEEPFGRLVSWLHAALSEHAGVVPRPSASAYRVPEGRWFADYLLRLEQLLAVRCASVEGVGAGFLTGEREIIDGNLGLCLQCPANVNTRLLLAGTIVSMNKVRPDVVREYTQKLRMLKKEKPLPAPAHAIIQRIFDEVLDE